jgi:hypothetical protein
MRDGTASPRAFERWRILLLWFVLAWSLTIAMLLAACDSGGTECQCQPTGLLLQICPAVADEVENIQLSGNACDAAKLVVIDAGPDAAGTLSYDIQPTQAGLCGVLVSFKNGLTYAADQGQGGLVVQQGPACCTGLYPNGSREIQACVEAGASEAEAPNDAPSES